MQVILRDDVTHLGRRGEIVKVAEGYARNYLLPKGLAYLVTSGIERQVKSELRAKTAREKRERESAEQLAARLRDVTVLRFTRRAGETGVLFGSVTSADVAEALAGRGLEFDKRAVRLEEPIKRVGTHRVAVHLLHDLEVELVVEVEAGEGA